MKRAQRSATQLHKKACVNMLQTITRKEENQLQDSFDFVAAVAARSNDVLRLNASPCYV